MKQTQTEQRNRKASKQASKQERTNQQTNKQQTNKQTNKRTNHHNQRSNKTAGKTPASLGTKANQSKIKKPRDQATNQPTPSSSLQAGRACWHVQGLKDAPTHQARSCTEAQAPGLALAHDPRLSPTCLSFGSADSRVPRHARRNPSVLHATLHCQEEIALQLQETGGVVPPKTPGRQAPRVLP